MCNRSPYDILEHVHTQQNLRMNFRNLLTPESRKAFKTMRKCGRKRER